VIVLDASVLIAHFDSNDASHARAAAALLEVADHQLGASAITIAEVLVGPARAGKLGVARVALRELEVDEIPVPAGAAERLAELRAGTDLKLPDCCVLYAAEQVRADGILTFDDRLAKRSRDRGYGSGR
jgi:predicted nucleic acid-binding protein